MAKNGRGRGGKIEVEHLSAECRKVGLVPTGGWRATLAMNIILKGPDGQRYRGGGARLHVRVYPVLEPSPGRRKPGEGTGAKKKAGARKKTGRKRAASAE